MLDLTPGKLFDDVQRSLDLRRKVTQASAARIRQYTGSAYMKGYGSNALENFAYKWVSVMVPQMVMYNPTVRVTTGSAQGEHEAAYEEGFKVLLPSIMFAKTLMRIAFDVQFDFGVALVSKEPTPEAHPGPFVPLRPTCARVSPRQYFRDHKAAALGAPRFEGHISLRQLDDLKQATDAHGQPMYDAKALDMAAVGDVKDIISDLMQDGFVVGDATQGLLPVVSMYDAERQMVCTYAMGMGGMTLLREDEADSGHDSPYVLFGIWDVPDQIYPLSPLAVSQDAVEALNKQLQLMDKANETARRLLVVNSTSTEIKEQIANAPYGSILSIPGFNGILNVADIGGARPDQYEYTQMQRTDLDRLTGLTDQTRGIPTGSTATGESIAAQFTDTRLKYAQNVFRDRVGEVLTKMAAMMDDPNVAFPLPDDENGSGRTFVGEPMPAGLWQKRARVEVEPYSMEYVNQGMLRAQLEEAQKAVIGMVQARRAMPELQAQKMVDDLLATLNVPRAANRYVNWPLQDAMIGMQAAAVQSQGMQAPPQGQPPQVPIVNKKPMPMSEADAFQRHAQVPA